MDWLILLYKFWCQKYFNQTKQHFNDKIQRNFGKEVKIKIFLHPSPSQPQFIQISCAEFIYLVKHTIQDIISYWVINAAIMGGLLGPTTPPFSSDCSRVEDTSGDKVDTLPAGKVKFFLQQYFCTSDFSVLKGLGGEIRICFHHMLGRLKKKWIWTRNITWQLTPASIDGTRINLNAD